MTVQNTQCPRVPHPWPPLPFSPARLFCACWDSCPQKHRLTWALPCHGTGALRSVQGVCSVRSSLSWLSRRPFHRQDRLLSCLPLGARVVSRSDAVNHPGLVFVCPAEAGDLLGRTGGARVSWEDCVGPEVPVSSAPPAALSLSFGDVLLIGHCLPWTALSAAGLGTWDTEVLLLLFSRRLSGLVKAPCCMSCELLGGRGQAGSDPGSEHSSVPVSFLSWQRCTWRSREARRGGLTPAVSLHVLLGFMDPFPETALCTPFWTWIRHHWKSLSQPGAWLPGP